MTAPDAALQYAAVRPYTAPVWVSEFGTFSDCHKDHHCVEVGAEAVNICEDWRTPAPTGGPTFCNTSRRRGLELLAE